jgi:intein/homing endonuclease
MVDVKMGDGERLKLKFKDLFNLLKEGNDVHYDERGNEILTPEIKVKNFKDDLVGYSDVRRLIRHKVTKEKWLLKTVSGKEVIVTGDHSLTVVRNGKKITLKPKDVNIHTDYIIEVI